MTRIALFAALAAVIAFALPTDASARGGGGGKGFYISQDIKDARNAARWCADPSHPKCRKGKKGKGRQR